MKGECLCTDAVILFILPTINTKTLTTIMMALQVVGGLYL